MGPRVRSLAAWWFGGRNPWPNASRSCAMAPADNGLMQHEPSLPVCKSHVQRQSSADHRKPCGVNRSALSTSAWKQLGYDVETSREQYLCEKQGLCALTGPIRAHRALLGSGVVVALCAWLTATACACDRRR